MKTFQEVVKENMSTLEQYVPVVARVHGNDHPEFHEVKKLFDEMNRKLKDRQLEKVDLTDDFSQLRQVTNNYTVPAGTCESYEAVYNMLSKLDKAYSN